MKKFDASKLTCTHLEHLDKSETHLVYYQLCKEACCIGFSDTSEALGRWFCSTLYYDENYNEWCDYCYPCAVQHDNSFMMCGRVVSDFTKLQIYKEVVE